MIESVIRWREALRQERFSKERKVDGTGLTQRRSILPNNNNDNDNDNNNNDNENDNNNKEGKVDDTAPIYPSK